MNCRRKIGGLEALSDRELYDLINDAYAQLNDNRNKRVSRFISLLEEAKKELNKLSLEFPNAHFQLIDSKDVPVAELLSIDTHWFFDKDE